MASTSENRPSACISTALRFGREQIPNIPWRCPGEPWEIARLALYLASEDSDYVTGQSFTIDGGLEMNWGQGA